MALFDSMNNQNQTDVSLIIAKHLLSKEGNGKNLVFSPLSIQVMLGMIAARSDEGPTRDHVLSFLQFKSMDHLNSFASHLVNNVLIDASLEGGPTLRSARSAWVDLSKSLEPSFKDILHTYYKAALVSVDFRKVDDMLDELNSWIEKETNGLIKNVLSNRSFNSSSTGSILVNVLYFKGEWDRKFDASVTKDQDFHLLNGTSIKTPFMIRELEEDGNEHFVSVLEGFKVLRLFYKQGSRKSLFSMYLFLPDAKDGLPTLVEKVGSEPGFLINSLPRNTMDVVDLRIPRFKISSTFEASSVLQEPGIVLPYLNHTSIIEVNEEGTQAAAEEDDMAFGLFGPPVTDFVADHPFLFMIREDISGTILFIGQVLNPLSE